MGKRKIMEKVEEYKFGYISGQRVVVYNNSTHSFRIFEGRFLEDITVELKKEGSLRITGKEVVYNFYFHDTLENDWEEEPEEKYILTKRVGFWDRREVKYLKGWVRTKKRIPVDLEFGNGWTLERLKDEEN